MGKRIYAEEAREMSGGLTTEEHLDKLMDKIDEAAASGDRSIVFKRRKTKTDYNEWAEAVRQLQTKFDYTFSFEGEQTDPVTEVRISW
jgi:hypothetical protein